MMMMILLFVAQRESLLISIQTHGDSIFYGLGRLARSKKNKINDGVIY